MRAMRPSNPLRFALLILVAAPSCTRSAAPPEPPPAPITVVGRRIDIEAKVGGYSPSTVEVGAGEQVTLVFTRTIKSHCLEEIMIPSLGVKKTLPLNQPVAIPFAPDRYGPVPFSCGMDMVHGRIEVK